MRKNPVNEEKKTSGFIDEQAFCVDDFEDPITKMPARARVYQRLTEANQNLLHKLYNYGSLRYVFCTYFFFVLYTVVLKIISTKYKYLIFNATVPPSSEPKGHRT